MTEETDVKGAPQSEEDEVHQNGLVKGVPGRRVSVNGVLDLRGVPREEVAGIESLKINGIVLLDEANRSGLAHAAARVNGSIVVVDPDLRVIVEPNIEFSRGSVEAMAAGQKLMLVGNVYFRPEIPPALAAEKFEQLHVVGILIACEGVLGALTGKTEMTGITISLPDSGGHVVRSMGQSTWNSDYLSRLPDSSIYINVGATTVPEDVEVDLVERKIAAYYNVGMTSAASPVLSLLRARCSTNLGNFSPLDGEEEA